MMSPTIGNSPISASRPKRTPVPGKAGIVYADIWDGFVDEAGRYSAQGPDYEGQIRRLRTGDGVYFTKFGARKQQEHSGRSADSGRSGSPARPLIKDRCPWMNPCSPPTVARSAARSLRPRLKPAWLWKCSISARYVRDAIARRRQR
jgi:hypothetical protein